MLEQDLQCQIVITRKSGVYHLLPVCFVYVEARINLLITVFGFLFLEVIFICATKYVFTRIKTEICI